MKYLVVFLLFCSALFGQGLCVTWLDLASHERIEGGRLQGGDRVGTGGRNGGAYHAKYWAEDRSYLAIETILPERGSRKDMSLSFTTRASELGLAPRLYTSTRAVFGDTVQTLLYSAPFARGRAIALGPGGEPLVGNYKDLRPRLNALLDANTLEKISRRYRSLAPYHPDFREDNVMMGIVRDGASGEPVVLVQGIDWDAAWQPDSLWDADARMQFEMSREQLRMLDEIPAELTRVIPCRFAHYWGPIEYSRGEIDREILPHVIREHLDGFHFRARTLSPGAPRRLDLERAFADTTEGLRRKLGLSPPEMRAEISRAVGNPYHVVKELDAWPARVIFHPDGKTLLTHDDKNLRQIDIASGDRLPPEIPPAYLFGYSPDGKIVVTQSVVPGASSNEDLGVAIFFWDSRTGQPIGHRPLAKGTEYFRELVFSPNSEIMAAISADRHHVQFWRIGSPESLGDPIDSEEAISTLDFDPRREALLLAGWGAGGGVRLRVWSWVTREFERDFLLERKSGHFAVKISPDGRQIALFIAESDRGKADLLLIDSAQGALLNEVTFPYDFNAGYWSVALNFDPEGKILWATVGASSSVGGGGYYRWDLDKRYLEVELKGGRDGVEKVYAANLPSRLVAARTGSAKLAILEKRILPPLDPGPDVKKPR